MLTLLGIFAAAGAIAQTPAIRTENGTIVFQAANGARLTLTNSEAEPCPVVDTPPSPPSVFGGGGGGGGGGVAWTEVYPAELAANSGEAAITVIGACNGGSSCGVFHSRSSRSIQCQFTGDGNSPPMVVQGVVSISGADPTNTFFEVTCPVPIFDYSVPAALTTTVSFKGEQLPFVGAEGADQFQLVTKITAPVVWAPGQATVILSGKGFRSSGQGYTCRVGPAGVTPNDMAAVVTSNSELSCNISQAPGGIARTMDYQVQVVDIATNLAVRHQPSSVLRAGTLNAEGVIIPATSLLTTVTVDTCRDSVSNNNETDVDCGGRSCPACPENAVCERDSDCLGDLACEGGRCFADGDGDGQSVSQGDCDDTDPAVFRGAPELYDGKDNDCDGEGADGPWSNQLASNLSKTSWEFTSIVRSGSIVIRQPGAITIYSIGPIALGSDIDLNGGAGQASAQAYNYRQSNGGAAAYTANGNRGGHGGPGSYSERTAQWSGVGPGRGWNARGTSYGPGGSGAGHANIGQRGGTSNNGVAGPSGGAQYGSSTRPQLNPGSGGGAGGYGGARNQAGSAGGGGGGAIKLVSPVSIEVAGIACKGGNGGQQGGNSGDAGTGGGGSGGTIWLEAPTVIVNGALDVRGGAGGRILYRGGTGGSGSPGRVWIGAQTLNMRGSVQGGNALRYDP